MVDFKIICYRRNVKNDDIASSYGIADYKRDEGEVPSGNLYLTIDFLDIGEIANILFKHQNSTYVS